MALNDLHPELEGRSPPEARHAWAVTALGKIFRNEVFTGIPPGQPGIEDPQV